ncbi:MAG TPA: ABC transporter permease [Bacteroidales bacterium]|nr:ABC transporter permease [Bacteroidales bacterium]
MSFRLFKEGFLFAISSIMVNKFRTFLSLFGITIGIVSIISVFTVLDWMEKSVRDTIASMGDNVVYVQKWPWTFNDPNLAWWDMIKWPPIAMDDYNAIRNKSTKSESACLTVYQNEPVKYKKNVAPEATVAATTPEFKDIRTFEIDKGRYFSQFEASSGKNVAIIGSEVAKNLFAEADPVGKEITIAGFKTTVIGVIKKEGKGGIADSGMDEITIIPVNFGKTFINFRNRFVESQLMIKAKPGVNISELSDETTMILRASRRLQPEAVSTFSVNQASMITQGFNSVFAGINLAGWFISGLAIIVGGFGIANIMFVSVRERTNQIGIQKALGAKRSFILMQFLTESVLLSIIGGVVGLFLIFIGTLVINYLYELNMYLTAGNIIMAIAISGAIGIIAGYAPAYSAAKMDPVEAIGYSFG